jgi:hypothetical protein
MRISEPSYQIEPCNNKPDYFYGAAYFNRKSPSALRPHGGIGRVQNIRGKPQAREIIAERALKALERLRRNADM